jgi:signal transduction histidine kinase
MKRKFLSEGFVASFPQMVRRLLFFDHSPGVRATHRKLLESRCSLAMIVGVIVYGTNTIEPWIRFHHDLNVVKWQLGATLLIALVFLSSLTSWGRRHKLLLLVIGLLIGTAGFEKVVCVARVFNSDYSDGFPVLFAYYSILIPTTVFQSALVGVAISLVLAIPATLVIPAILAIPATHSQIFYTMLISNATPFVLLLSGRHIANSSWERETLARERESAFVSALSHEFGNSLTTLCFTATHLRAGQRADPVSQATAYQTLFKESHRLQSGIKRLLEFARVEAGIDPSQFTTLDPIELVTGVVQEFQENHPCCRHLVDVEVGEQVPLIKGDEVTLKLMLRNLLDNAVKYSPNNQEVWLSVGGKSGYAVFSVRDRGMGINQGEKGLIFNAFSRGAKIREGKIRGTGIGLALVKNIAMSHGGIIHLESTEGKGSVFTVTLPGGEMNGQNSYCRR